MKSDSYLSIGVTVAFVVMIVLALIFLLLQTRRHNEKFTATTARYCSGCHAQLPPSVERDCNCPNSTNNCQQCCECRCRKRKPELSDIQREDLFLYSYLTSLLHTMGVDDTLHDI